MRKRVLARFEIYVNIDHIEFGEDVAIYIPAWITGWSTPQTRNDPGSGVDWEYDKIYVDDPDIPDAEIHWKTLSEEALMKIQEAGDEAAYECERESADEGPEYSPEDKWEARGYDRREEYEDDY